MIHKFLNAKHWQLFMLTFGIPFLLQIVASISMFRSFDSNDSMGFVTAFLIFPLIVFFNLGCTFGWLWSLGIGLQKYIPAEYSIKTKRFRIFFWVPVVYLLFVVTLIGTSIYGISIDNHAIGGIVGKLLFLIIPLHLFSMFCTFYLLYFVSKTFKTIELRRTVSFSDFIGEFFMIWFLPFGIWLIQPRINKLVSQTDHNQHLMQMRQQ